MDRSLYRERMIGYYPIAVSSLEEIKAIVDAEYPEFGLLEISRDGVIENAYLGTMGEDRIAEWEHILDIIPVVNSSVEDRRETIIARLRGTGKLNTALIDSIVNAFTGGYAKSWIERSVLYVDIMPPKGNKDYKFANVEQELAKRVPAHLGLSVARGYSNWGEIKSNFASWQTVKDYGTWEDVWLYIPPRG